MTGPELRQKVCNIMLGWVGGAYQGANHQEIIRIWNAGKNPGQYTMNLTAPYCAATVSAAWIKAGIGAYTPIDTYCPTMISKAKTMGMWVESDAHTPHLGDAILYDWYDGSNYANYDNTTEPGHVGLVTSVSGSSFTVVEGNINGGRIGTRSMQVNGRYIRGFVCPDYDAIAAAIGGSEEEDPAPEPKEDILYGRWKSYRNGSTEEPVYRDSDRTMRVGSLNPYEIAWCCGRYGDSYMVTYKLDGSADNYGVGYVGYDGGVVD